MSLTNSNKKQLKFINSTEMKNVMYFFSW